MALRRPASAAVTRSASASGARPATASASRPTNGGAENTVESLKRRFRQLEQNHREWQEQVQKDLRRQKTEIDSLRRDNEPLKQQVNELRAAEATSAGASGGASLRGPNSRGMRSHRELDAKRDTVSHLQSKLKEQQQRIRELNEAIDKVRQELKRSRKDMGGVNVTQESHSAVQKQVTVLENRLDQSLLRFNEVLRKNKELRDQIDTLRGEREVFDEIYLKLEADLQDKKKEMAFIIEVSNIAYEERDNNVQVLQNLKAFSAEEMNSFAETFKELDELLEEDRKMKEQVKARLAALEKKERALDEDLLGSGKASRNAPKSTLNQADQPEPTEDAAISQMRQYEDAFNKIRHATSIPDLDGIVERFLRSEEENYSLFTYVNDLGREIEKLEKQRGEVLDAIDQVALGNETDKARRATLRELEDKLRAEEHRGQNFADMSLRNESILRSIMTTVEQLFARLDCDEKAVIERHGVAGLTLETVLLYLAGIELRTDEYLTAWCRQNGMLDSAGPLRGPQVPYDAMQITIDPKRLPGTGEDADGSDDDTHPLSPEELLRKAQRKLQGAATVDRRNVRGRKGVAGNPSTVKKVAAISS